MSIDDSRDSRDKDKPQYDRHPELDSPQEKRRQDRERVQAETIIPVKTNDYLRLRVMLYEGQEIAVRIVNDDLTQKEWDDSVWNGEANRS